MGKIKTSQIKEQSRWSPNQVYSFRRELLKCLIIGYYYKSLYLDNRAVSFSSLAQNSKHYSLKFSSVLHFSIWKQTHQYKKKNIYIYITNRNKKKVFTVFPGVFTGRCHNMQEGASVSVLLVYCIPQVWLLSQ